MAGIEHHTVVTYYQCLKCTSQVTESIIFISPDTKHDHNAVHDFMDLVVLHLRQKRGIDIGMMVRFSDGCASQYKSRGPIADIAKSQENYQFPLSHNYFGSRHGKGPADGEAAVIKSHATNAVKSGTAVIRDARALYEHCTKNLEKEPTENNCLHFRTSFYFVEEVIRDRAESQIKTIPGTRAMHSILSLKNQDQVKKRDLSCFCSACKDGTLQGCENAEFVEDWQTIGLKKLMTSLLSPILMNQQQ
ncbi:uncharacterized protein LOC110988175 [Acanthaster planci]|uniref:Uncharacterized protein LOC110988175 n=1 Tax=Acanthaster planci TaxID=133434 RepID=A0A8B7ZQK1_ACAPL|nr:uncharacterized protein LOC110988175 [Acanthaster planci]